MDTRVHSEQMHLTKGTGDKQLRLALTISGAVALGAFEGGVLAALISAIRPLCQGEQPSVRLDAIGGASAGSITGLLAARCLTGGIDPVEVMKEAWVNRDSIQRLLLTTGDSPLSSQKLRKMARDLVDPARMKPVDGFQTEPVRLSMTLACLRGLEYTLRSLSSRGPITATTFVDLRSVNITTEQSPESFVTPRFASPVDVALASGANAVGFPPAVLDCTAVEQEYADRGIAPQPSDLWYTDGGTLDNEPLGHTLDLVGEIDEHAGDNVTRLHVLIHPHPAGGPTGDSWAAPGRAPTWLETLFRAQHLQRTQSLYDDLRRVEKTNSHIIWLNRLDDMLGSFATGLCDTDRANLTSALRQMLQSMDADVASFSPDSPETPVRGNDPQTLLYEAVSRIAGVSGKQCVAMEVISPLVLADRGNASVGDMLAGEVLGHFGGFFDKRLRLSDFDLGYACALDWLEAGGLTAHDLDPELGETALQSARNAYTPEDRWIEFGNTSVLKIMLRHPLAFVGLIAQMVRVVVQDLLTWPLHRQ